MKTNRFLLIFALGAMLVAMPAMAQNRGGGGGGSRGGGVSSSSRGGSSSHGSSFSSSSRGSISSSSGSSNRGSFFSGSSHSNSSSRSQGVSSSNNRISSPSRSVQRNSSSSSDNSRNGSVGNRSNSGERYGNAPGRNNSANVINRRNNSRGAVGVPSSSAPAGRSSAVRATRSENAPGGYDGSRLNNPNKPGDRYARPGHPGHMPPSHRPMHPAPYFHHPYHHHMIHMRPIFWHPVPPRPIFWPGFWLYCNTYWYDYHVTDVTVVHKYVQDTYNVDMISYAISGDYMYAIVHDVDGKYYLQVFDKEDKLLAEQEISRKYIKTEIDRENGGCWIFKKKDKDPMLFLYVDGQLLIYEAD